MPEKIGSKIFSIAVLITVTLVVVLQTLPPDPLSAGAPASEFSADRAFEHVRAIAGQPRPTGSLANAAARKYILTTLEDIGLETETQPDGALENVLGKIVGTGSPDAILLTAHLDSVSNSPGATDDGSGVAVLLETARALMLEGPFRNTVIFLFTDDEEAGLYGAKAFIAHHPWAKDVKVVIGFDAGGLSGPAVLSKTSPDNGWLIQQLAHSGSYFIGSSAISALADSGTDFGHAFRPAGFSGYAFDLYWDRRIHTPDDNIENLDLASIQHQGYHALSLARHFANLDQLTDPRQFEAIYFSIFRLTTIVYPSTWSIPLAVAVSTILFGILAFGLRRKFLTWRGMGFGAFVLLVGVIIAPLPGILLAERIHGIPLRFVGRSLDLLIGVIPIVVPSSVLIILWYFLCLKIKRASLADLTLGTLILAWVGMLGTALVLPALSFALTWPLLISLLACVNWFYGYAERQDLRSSLSGFILSGAASIVILGPTIILGLFDQMTLTLLLLGLLFGFLAPIIHFLLGRSFEIA